MSQEQIQVPKGWELMTLGDICDIDTGFAFKSDTFQTSGIPLVRIGNIQNEKVEFKGSTIFLNEKFINKYQKFVVKKNDILIALSGATTGKSAIYDKDEPVFLNQRVGRIKLKKYDVNLKKYVYYFIKKVGVEILKKSWGGAQPNISPKSIEKFEILIPNDEKILCKIVQKLDDILVQLEEKKKKILELNNPEKLTVFIESNKFSILQLIRTGLLASGNWKNYPKVKLGEITKITSGGTPNRQNQEYWNGNIPWLKSGELLDDDINDSEEYITKKGLGNSSTKLFPKDTILVALYGQGKTRGKTGRLLIEASTNQAICAIFPNKIFLSKYVQYWIRSLYWELRRTAPGGAQPNWNSSTIKEIEITLPSLDEQKKSL